MAGSQKVSYTKRSFTEIVNKLDPQRLSTPQVVYVFDNGKVKTELPDLPGQEYRWAKGLPPNDH